MGRSIVRTRMNAKGGSGGGAAGLGYTAENIANKATDFSTINNILYPTVQAVNDAITSQIAGLDWKENAAVATTTDITLSGEQTIDTILTSASRVLVKNQADATQNGIYVSGAGAWTRSADANTGALLDTLSVNVTGGAVNGNLAFIQTNHPITLGVSDVDFQNLNTSVAAATDVTSGIMKLYTTTGVNVDGTMDQNSITTALATKLGSLPITNTLWVTKAGNDTSGTRGRADLPYLTIAGAQSDALAGDTIIVMPGDYVEATTLTLTDGINFEFLGTGSVYATAGSKTIDIASGATVFINSPGWRFFDDFTKIVFNATVPCNVTFIFKQLDSLYGTAAFIEDDVAFVTLKGEYALTVDTYATIEIGNCNAGTNGIIIDIDTIECQETSGRAVYIGDGNIRVKSKLLKNTVGGGSCIKVNNSTINSTMHFDIDEAYGGTGWTVWVDGACTSIYYNGNRVIGGGTCTVVSSGSTQFITRISEVENTRPTSPYGIYHSEGTSTLVGIGSRVKRNPAVVGGSDIKADAGSFVKLIACDYDRTKTNIIGTFNRLDNSFYDGVNIGATTNAQSHINTAKVTLTAAQIKTLNTVPVSIVVAPGSGYAIQVLDGSVRTIPGTVAFTNTDLNLTVTGAAIHQAYCEPPFDTLVAGHVKMTLDTDSTVTALVDNAALRITGSADSAVGDSTAVVYITYKILKL